MKRLIPVMLAVLALQAGCEHASGDAGERPPEAELLHSAVRDLTGVIVYDIFSPPQASRAYAYASIAAYEALRPSHPGVLSLAGQLNGLEPLPEPAAGAAYYAPLAAVHAFYTVGHALTFSRERMDSLRAAAHARVRALGVADSLFAPSLAYGERVAEHVLAWSRQDHFLQTRGYPKFTVTDEPGRWTPTPPSYMDAVEPNWARLRPFALDSASQMRPPAPVPYDTAAGSAFVAQAREVYEVGRSLTEEQRAVAEFWNDNPYTMNVRGHAMFATKKVSPGGHWMGIAATAARLSGADAMRAAEAYALTAIAIADGFISCWDEKFRSNVVRPETVINARLDEGWEPLLQTPPFPEYPSGHSVVSTAAATVLGDRFGRDLAFEDSTEVPYGLPTRAFPSFDAAAAEAAVSRLYGGIHYRQAIEEGARQGRRVGEHLLRRVRTRG